MMTDTRPPPTITDRCGTRAGYEDHVKRRRERPCALCRDAWRVYQRDLRARRYVPPELRTDPTRRPGCGVPSGYSAHHRAGEHACGDCKQAMVAKQKEYYHHRGGNEVQRRRRSTATSQRLSRERHQRKADQARLDKLDRLSRPRRWWQRLTRRT